MLDQQTRGLRLLDRKAFPEAAKHFRRCVRSAPGSAMDRVLLAHALVGMGQLGEAEEELLVATGLAPRDPEIQAFLGHVAAQAGRRVQAVLHLEKAVALSPGHSATAMLTELRGQIAHSVHRWHLPMLADQIRNQAFQDAIEAVVTTDDVVLDIGTGSGLLAMMAARAGARQVIACEMLPDLAALARLVVDANGFARQITVIGKPSTELVVGVDLPERATVVVSETFDSLLIGEGAIGSFAHAREHLMAPGARVIPQSGTIIGQLASVPRLKQVHPLNSISGFDLRPFGRRALDKQFYPLHLETEDWTAFSQPFPVLRLDFRADMPMRQDWSVRVPATATGVVDALVLWFDLRLTDSINLGSGPQGRKAAHWDPVVFLFDRCVPVRDGDQVTVQARMGENVFYFEI